MTELNDSPETAAAPPRPQWPGRDTLPGDSPGVPTGDPAVDAVLRRLDGIPDTPVAEHSGLYAGIHDALREALDAEPADAGTRRDGES
ncbi:hypothetical protein [Arthrobacter sp. CJ23]|uniref:hypothetical protein n=1 Tax=Arthrobacter sp. CJ23 TaxID=2972479 RepID=UPI00215D082C|nr:hypothetical protein [Arthrobacter sp. CJ23]UVJ40996.1 hypothetical protein NVV90_07500 [Arthrobacter sp. CJ23]